MASLEVPTGMHICILACGTYGDVQPFLYIGQRLKVRRRRCAGGCWMGGSCMNE